MNTRALKTTAIIFSLATGSLLSGAALRANAEDKAGAASIAGTWMGAVQTSNRPVAARFVFTSAEDNLTSLRFGAPWACTLSFSYSSQKGDTFLFKVRDSNGGPCDKYYNGTLAVMAVDNSNNLSIELTDAKNASTIKTYLNLVDRVSGKAKALPAKKLSKNKSN